MKKTFRINSLVVKNSTIDWNFLATATVMLTLAAENYYFINVESVCQVVITL